MTDTPSVEDKLSALKKQYINSLPDKFSEILQLWQSNKNITQIPDKMLETALHKLAGSAGMYDEHKLGEIARTVEIIVSEIDNDLEDDVITQIDSDLEQLKITIANLSP